MDENFQPTDAIDKKRLKALSARSDSKGLTQLAGHVLALAVTAAALIGFALTGNAIGALGSLALIGLSVALNRGMVLFFARQRGLLFAVAGWAFHQLHLFYSATTFVLCTLVALQTRGLVMRSWSP